MSKIMTSRQSQLRVLGSALLVSSGIFLGSMTLDRNIYDGLLNRLFSDQDKNADLNTLAVSDRQAGSLNIKQRDPILPEASDATVETTKAAPDPEQFEKDLIWLARCTLSETDRPHEMELVAWVIRNRVETAFRGKDTYEKVVLDPYQFSAFNAGSRVRSKFMGLTRGSKYPRWKEAIEVAAKVINADDVERPFSAKTRHFYSEISMTGHNEPMWANGRVPVVLPQEFNIQSERFRFYRGIW